MDILVSSWLVLSKELGDILSILGIFLLGGGIVLIWLRVIFCNNLTAGEYFVLSIGGALFPLSFGVLVTLLLNFLLGIIANFIVIYALTFIVSCFAVYPIWRSNRLQSLDSNFFSPASGYRQIFSKLFSQNRGIISILALILIFVGSVYVRLAFILGLITPLYFDSALHYSIIQGLISKIDTSSLATINSLVDGYYHLGYHAIIASLSLALNLDITNVMLIFGQIIVAIIPLPLFFIIRQEVESDTPAIFATLLAGWGWSMPAFSVNWGKYPALTSILPFEIFLCSIYLVVRSPKRYRWILAGFSSFCLLVSTFIHTRSFALITIVVVSSILSKVCSRLPKPVRAIILVLVGLGIAMLVFFIQSKPVFSSMFQPYQKDGFWMLLLVLLLLPFALNKFSTATFSAVFSLLFFLVSIFTPINRFVPGFEVQTLLDRPYVEMVLFFPLAFLGGLGCAGLTKILSGLGLFQGKAPPWVKTFTALLLFGALAINATQYNFFPSTCCQFFGEDDAVAFDWMDKNLPPDANIGISSYEAYVLDAQSTSSPGTDGGVWIVPLIHRNPVYLNSQTNFRDQKTLTDLCEKKITHIYVGGREESFSLLQLQEQPAWYETLLLLPKAQVFKIIGCK